MKIPPWLVAALVPPLYRLWCKTLRYEEINRHIMDTQALKGPMVVCLWHGEFFPLLHVRRHLTMGVIVSRSNDGEYITRILQACGFRTPRGSSTRGGAAALLQAAKLMRDEDVSLCITVDGPKGPRHKVKEGAIYLARQSAAPILPVRVHMERPKIFHRAWDKFQVPMPFSKLTVYYGATYTLPPEDLTDETLGRDCAELEEKLLHLLPEGLGKNIC